MPQKIKILNIEYTVLPVEDLYDVYSAYGLFNGRLNVIKYQTGMQPKQEKAKLLHEFIHAIDEQLQLELTEQQVSGISESILTFSDIDFKFEK
jgi:uncharacterized protein YpuA (DUF1002 family)